MALTSFQLQQQADVGADVYVLRLGCNCEGTVLAAATSEHAVCVLDSATMQPARVLEGHTDIVEDLTFFQGDPNCLASCSRDGSARIWDLRAAETARHFPVSSQEVYSCSVGRQDTALACAASEKLHLFDIAQGRMLRIYRDCHTDVVNHVRFHPVDTAKLLSGAEDNLVVLVDTDAREDDAILAVIPNEDCVRSFTLVGPARNTLCCASTTEDVRIWGLSEDDCGIKRAEFLGLRDHPLLAREDSGGYVVEMFFDQPSGQVFLLAGAGMDGDLALFRVTLEDATPVATFNASTMGSVAVVTGDATSTGTATIAVSMGHRGVVRSAVCMPGGAVVSAGEDGRICVWREDPAVGNVCVELEPSAYGARRLGRSDRAAPY